jgi:hypothetical protein
VRCEKKYSKIVFIDPGTNLGWAKWQPPFKGAGKQVITSGSAAFPKTPGPRVVAFVAQLEELLGKFCAADSGAYVAWEEAAFSFKGGRAERMYGTWEGLLMYFCETRGIPYQALNGSTLKAYARANGFYTPSPRRPNKLKKGASKADKKTYADALAVWKKNKKNFDAKPRPRPTWKLSSEPKMQEHEIDARWGLEFIMKQLEVLK